MKRLNAKKMLNIISLIVMFTSMCVLRIWYAVPLFFAMGIVITLVLKNRAYCGYACPMGALSDLLGGGNSKQLRVPRYIKYGVYIVFWGYIIYNVFMYISNPTLLWFKMFRFSVIIIGTSLILQILFKDRTWCTTLCPVGGIISYSAYEKSKGPEIDSDKCTSCGKCASVCPLEKDLTLPAVQKVNTKICLQCNKCTQVCVSDAIYWN